MRFIDLFSGAGGLSYGLEQAGFECVYAIDHNEDAIRTFNANHKNKVGIAKDIQTISDKEILTLKNIDLVVGGPPCQGFSTIGRGDAQDKRNFLFLDFVRFVTLLQPKYVLIENVRGLLSEKNDPVLNQILDAFFEIGYSLEYRVLASHQYGVPQERYRTIFIGNRLGYRNKFPEPQEPPYVVVENALSGLTPQTANHDLSQTVINSSLEKQRIALIPEGKYIRYEQDELTYFPPRLRLGVDWKKLGEIEGRNIPRLRQSRYRRLHRQEQSPTILTSKNVLYHPTEDRYLSVREAASIQSFPNDFVFYGTNLQQWRQVGNAVPPLLGKALAESLIEMEATKKPVNKELLYLDDIFDL